jgi:hypothetical protein
LGETRAMDSGIDTRKPMKIEALSSHMVMARPVML